MHNDRQRQLSDPFDMFGGFGNFRGFGSSIFGRNPFDDPFFTHPSGSMFPSNNTLHESPLVSPPSIPIIKELGSDDEYEEEEMENTGEEGQWTGTRPANEPFVDHPDDEVDDRKRQTNDRADYNRAGGTQPQSDYNRAVVSKPQSDSSQAEGSQPQSFKVHSCKVKYGGVDGVYYTSSATRRMGSDGMIMEDCKEADKRTGEATHRFSRGLNEKGHSVSRKLKPDGKVDMLQTLHNLNEDELGSFEEAWKDRGGKQVPFAGFSGSGVDQMSDWGGFLLPSTRHTGDARGSRPRNENVAGPAGGRTKKVVRIPID